MGSPAMRRHRPLARAYAHQTSVSNSDSFAVCGRSSSVYSVLPSLLDVAESVPLSACCTGSDHASLAVYVGVVHEELDVSGSDHAG